MEVITSTRYDLGDSEDEELLAQTSPNSLRFQRQAKELEKNHCFEQFRLSFCNLLQI